MLRIASTLLFFITLGSANALAFTSNEKSLKVWGGSTGVAAKFKDAPVDASMQGSWLETGVSYQFTNNFFGEFNYTKNRIDSFEIDGQTIDSEDTWTSKTVGIGFRAARSQSIGKYYGAAYYHAMSSDESDEASGTVSLFMEKDTTSRYGRLGLTRATKDASGTTIGGRHVWFLQSGLGLGLDWSYFSATDTATFNTEVKYTETSGGLLLMFRL